MRRNNVRLGLGMVATAAALLGTATASIEAAPVKIDAVVSGAPLANERSPPLAAASWPRHANLPLTYHRVPDIA